VPKAAASTRRARVVVDLQALQSPTTKERGIGRYAANWANAVEAHDPKLVDAYVLNPTLPPAGRLDSLTASGKLIYVDDLDLSELELWHTVSPFDLALSLESLMPCAPFNRGVRHTATVYDLIPARSPDTELIDTVDRRRYRTRIEMIRSCDALLTLSKGVANDLVLYAGIDEFRVHAVGAAADHRFQPAKDRERAREIAVKRLAHLGAHGPYLLAASGSHPRKNNEALIRAFVSLDEEVVGELQLIITGAVDAPTANHYRHLASTANREGSVIPAGFVDDVDLVTLTQGAELAVVAGLTEGFGLPIVEAMACATPVICSDIAPFNELVSDEGRFDPTNEASIAATLARVLGDEAFRERLRVQPPDAWSDVAKRTQSAIHQVLTAPPRRSRAPHSLRRSRPRLAVVTPLPPAPSGVAGYSYALIGALLRTEKANVDVFCEGTPADALVPDGAGLYDAAALGHIERLAGRYDHVIYTIGNSHHHLGALAWIRRRPGIVIAHDVRLANLYRHEHGDPSMIRGGFEHALHQMYPDSLPSEIGRDGEIAIADLDRYGIFMAREVISLAELFLVSSRAAASLASLDAGPGHQRTIELLPFAFTGEGATAHFVEETRAAPSGLHEAMAANWARRAAPPERPVIAHFGIVDPAKQPELIMRAHREVIDRGDDVVLAFVGPIGDELAVALGSLAERLGTEASVILTGPLAPSTTKAGFTTLLSPSSYERPRTARPQPRLESASFQASRPL
jgi:glycosyltransferase involved in cell wall biosynthesis